MDLPDADFDDLVAEALDRIPPPLATLMDNVVVLVEDEPPPEEPDVLGLYVGTPLTEGLLNIHNALVGVGLRDQVKVGASGKVATGIDIVKRLIQGADFTNSARSMMMAVGCIQAQLCHTNTCPVGVATQDPKRMRALYVPDKTERVFHYQQHCVEQAMQLMGSMGVTGPDELRPHMLRRRMDYREVRSYAEIFHHLQPGELLSAPPAGSWARDWELATPDKFTV